jgi:hypothetical protein
LSLKPYSMPAPVELLGTTSFSMRTQAWMVSLLPMLQLSCARRDQFFDRDSPLVAVLRWRQSPYLPRSVRPSLLLYAVFQ